MSPESPHCCTPGTWLGSGSPWETSGGLGGGGGASARIQRTRIRNPSCPPPQHQNGRTPPDPTTQRGPAASISQGSCPPGTPTLPATFPRPPALHFTFSKQLLPSPHVPGTGCCPLNARPSTAGFELPL